LNALPAHCSGANWFTDSGASFIAAKTRRRDPNRILTSRHSSVTISYLPRTAKKGYTEPGFVGWSHIIRWWARPDWEKIQIQPQSDSG